MKTRRTTTFTCPACSGNVPFERYDPQLKCPYCGHVWHLSREEIGRLGKHNARVRAGLFKADAAEARAIRKRFYHGGKERSVRARLAFVVGALGLHIVAFLALRASGASPLVVVLVFFGLFFCVVIGSFALFYQAPETQEPARLTASPARCGRCGGRQELEAGEVFARCRFCDAALLPGATLMEQSEAEAARAAATKDR